MNREKLASKTASKQVAKVIDDIQKATRALGANLVPQQSSAQLTTVLTMLMAIHSDLSNHAEGVTAVDEYTVPQNLKANLRDATKRVAIFLQLSKNYLDASRMAPM